MEVPEKKPVESKRSVWIKKARPRLSTARLKAISIAAVILLSVSAGFLGGWLGASSRDHQAILDRQSVLSNESQLINDIATNVGDSVVSVNVTSQNSYDYYGISRSYEEESAGTGIILSSDGVIVTNRHVVPEGVTKVSVVLSDGTELEDVVVLGRTNANDTLDVAFLKITDAKGKQLKPAKIGDSANVKVGDKVVAIGNALGQFQNTVTQGIISGYGRNLVAGGDDGSEELLNLFQTDAAINHGNSGGPLVNMQGEVIGINTAVAGDGAENIGFAIPINDIKGLITSVLEKGQLERPYLGVRYVSLTDDIATQFELDTKRGAYILPESSEGPSVIAGSPAAKAGLKPGDIITKLNGKAINEKNSLISLINQSKVGQEVTLTVHRDGQDQEIKATLEAQP